MHGRKIAENMINKRACAMHSDDMREADEVRSVRPSYISIASASEAKGLIIHNWIGQVGRQNAQKHFVQLERAR